jgi:hypothetical protein
MPKQPTEPCQIEAVEAIMSGGKPRLVSDVMFRLNNASKGGWIKTHRKQVSKAATDSAILVLRTRRVLKIDKDMGDKTSYIHKAPRVTT